MNPATMSEVLDNLTERVAKLEIKLSSLREAAMTLRFTLPLRPARRAFERAYFRYQIKRAKGNMSRVAKAAGIDRCHLYRKLGQLGIRR
mgnify:CR=1 FL=1